MDRIDARQGRGHQRVTHLMIGDAASLLRAKHAALLLNAGDDAFDRHSEVVERDGVAFAPRRHDGRLIDQVREIGASEAWRKSSDLVKIDVRGKLHLGSMHLQDFATPSAVGTIDRNLAIKPSWTQQGRIKDLRAISGGEQDHASAWIKAIEFGEQLVER